MFEEIEGLPNKCFQWSNVKKYLTETAAYTAGCCHKVPILLRRGAEGGNWED
eukprot:c117_g1_i1 orf=2-154(-)